MPEEEPKVVQGDKTDTLKMLKETDDMFDAPLSKLPVEEPPAPLFAAKTLRNIEPQFTPVENTEPKKKGVLSRLREEDSDECMITPRNQMLNPNSQTSDTDLMS